MSLQTKLDEMRNKFEASAPEEALKVMHQATENLINSGISKRSLAIGDKAPEFKLNDHLGQVVSSANYLKSGPVVVTFYRGVW